MSRHAGLIRDPGIGIKNPADRFPGLERLQAGGEGVHRDLMHLPLPWASVADDNGPHPGGMVMAVGAGPFEGDLVPRREIFTAGEIAAQKRVRAGADDELIARIVAAATKNRALHGGQNVALEGSGSDRLMRRLQGVVGQFGRPAHIGKLGR